MRTTDFVGPAELVTALDGVDYLADVGIATAAFLARSLGRPLFLEGTPGVGKTALASAMAEVLDAELIRLQCFEGIDASTALYEWDFARQILRVRLAGDRRRRWAGLRRRRHHAEFEKSLYDRELLLARPVLRALELPKAVLLIDEIDRADDEFEALLLEVLEANTISVPQIGTISARGETMIVLTSNRTREVHDALKRRCLYHWIDLPEFELEVRIVQRANRNVPEHLAVEVVRLIRRLRSEKLVKPPGVSESIDLAEAVLRLGRTSLDRAVAEVTLGTVVKHQDDRVRVLGGILSGLFPPVPNASLG